MPTGYMTSTIADAPSTPHPVHGSTPGCEGNVTVGQNGQAVADAIGIVVGSYVASDPITAAVVDHAISKVIQSMLQKFQSNGNCALACLIVPQNATFKKQDIMCYVSYADPGKHANVAWTPFPQNIWGAGAFPNAYWHPDVADIPIPNDKTNRRLITKRMTNWSVKSELFGMFTALASTP